MSDVRETRIGNGFIGIVKVPYLIIGTYGSYKVPPPIDEFFRQLNIKYETRTKETDSSSENY